MELFDYQKRLRDDLVKYKHWGLFADVGCGKTAITIKASDIVNLPTLVVTTKSLKTNWNREIKMWSTDPSRFTVISKEDFRKIHSRIPHVGCLIIDESHYFFNFKSQMSKALASYIVHKRPDYLWLATATPILSSVFSVWTAGKLLNRLTMSYWSFNTKFFSQVKMGPRVIPVQKKGIEEDISKLLRSFGSVISKEEALTLPEQIHEYEYFALNKEQIKAIQDLDDDPTTITPIVYYTKCLQIANGTLKVSDTEYKEIKCDKADRLMELIEQYPNCVVVCRQKAELKMLHSKIKDSYIYDGDTPVEKRDEYIQIVNSGKGVLLLQADSGIGFNLQGVNIMIFYSHTWDFVKYSQCLGRTHRQGQKNKCVYVHLVTEKTIDEDVIKCLDRKESFDISLYKR